MSAIRPDLPALPQQSGAAPAVRAAQADFFRAAMARVEGARPQVDQARAVQAAPTPITTEPPRASGGARSEARAVRPGSLLDIRV